MAVTQTMRVEVQRIGRNVKERRADRVLASYPHQLTPASVASMMQLAAQGYPRDQVAFIDQMMESDPVFAGVYATRKRAVLGLDWKVVPDPKRVTDETKVQAEEIAAWCHDQLMAIETLEEFLAHNIDALGYGYAVSENVWTVRNGQHVITDIAPVAMASIVGDTLRPWIMRILLTDADSLGVLVDDHQFKFVKHVHAPINASPFRGGIARRCAVMHLTRRYGFQWWMSAMEMFGTPYRKATYKPGATPEEKNEMLEQLESFGHAGYGLFSEAMDFELVDQFKSSDTWPHHKFIEKIDEWYEITMLGQTLTTRVGETGGAYAAAKVHNDVREDIQYSDMRAEADVIRQYVLKPMVELNFGRGAPIPVWQRQNDEVRDMVSYSQVLDTAANRLGMQITAGFAYKELGIPLPEGVKPTDLLEGAPEPAPSPFGFQFKASASSPRPIFSKKKVVR